MTTAFVKVIVSVVTEFAVILMSYVFETYAEADTDTMYSTGESDWLKEPLETVVRIPLAYYNSV